MAGSPSGTLDSRTPRSSHTKPRMPELGRHHILMYSFRFSHMRADAAMPNTTCCSVVGVVDAVTVAGGDGGGVLAVDTTVTVAGSGGSLTVDTTVTAVGDGGILAVVITVTVAGGGGILAVVTTVTVAGGGGILAVDSTVTVAGVGGILAVGTVTMAGGGGVLGVDTVTMAGGGGVDDVWFWPWAVTCKTEAAATMRSCSGGHVEDRMACRA